MTLGYEANSDDGSTDGAADEPAVRDEAPRPIAALIEIHRSRPRDSWNWIWKDTVQRIVPLSVAGVVTALVFERENGSGYGRAGWLRETLLGIGIGLPLAAITAVFRAWVSPGYRLPTRDDQVVQTAYYLAINAPAEELFWRGSVQRVTSRLLVRIPHLRPAARPLGWVVATATYALYHRLGGWSWRSIAGVAFAGGIFGALYESRPRDRALVGVTIAHGLTTAAFLSWGDVFLHQLRLARVRRKVGVLPLRVMEAPHPR